MNPVLVTGMRMCLYDALLGRVLFLVKPQPAEYFENITGTHSEPEVRHFRVPDQVQCPTQNTNVADDFPFK
jgi:hypothetical protein